MPSSPGRVALLVRASSQYTKVLPVWSPVRAHTRINQWMHKEVEQQIDVSLSLSLFPSLKLNLKTKEYAIQQHTCSTDTGMAESWGWRVGPKAWGGGEVATVCITSVPKPPHSLTINISTRVYHVRATALGSNYILSLNSHNHQDRERCHHQIIQREDTQTPRGVLTHPRSRPVSVRGRIWAQVTLTPEPMLLSQL